MPELQNKDNAKLLSPNLFPVVGVGASAGGLEAFKRLVKAIPEHSGMAYILVQHLEPTHESALTDILQKYTNIPIQEITNNVQVSPNNIYTIPSNKLLTATDGVLQLSPRPAKKVKNMPIDVFFASLAEVHQSHAIGVILSGTATDGTMGLKTIKDHGGITIAQEQQSAAFDGMPQSAIDADVVDFILKPEEIPQQLEKLNQTLKTGIVNEIADVNQTDENLIRQILFMLRVRKGIDFIHYKRTTINRRIIRRMGLNKSESISDYLTYLKGNKNEQDILCEDLLISVTDFFRDKKTYESLCKTIFPVLLKNRDDNSPLRIWVAGCSTGEEPYTIAICLHEYLEDHAGPIKVQIFATDISEKSIAKARSGIYGKREVTSLSPGHLQKYFTKINGSFQINRFIRDICVFACHNFLKDPPFAKMDLISCRNALIYMESSLQKKALTTFHYALNDNGYLLLGKSETTNPTADLFISFDKSDKIYYKKPVPGNFLHVVANRKDSANKDRNFSTLKVTNRDDFQKSADDILLSKFAPPGVVVNDQMDIVQFRGSTGTWLEPYPGKPSLNVLKMAREGLAFELRNALYKVKASNAPLIKENIPVKFMGIQQSVTIEVIPLYNTMDPHFLILFKDSSYSSGVAEKDFKQLSHETQDSSETIRVTSLENELAQLREDMRSITENQEAVNEELQSANEELISGSEELQSLNEELETSKEELQSTNEELTTLNQELHDRNEQLNLSRIYAESIVATIREPLIVLDKNMRVKTANKSYYEKFNASEEGTEGKLFYEIGNGQWNISSLKEVFGNVLFEGKKITGYEIRQTFKHLGERIMILNARMIYREDNTEQLILCALEDVTETKRLEADLKLLMHDLEQKVEQRTKALKEANSLLRHSNENLEQFATIASHDLQEPLRKIRTFVNILNKRHDNDLSGEAKELLGKINLSAKRMSELIEDVLNFSKVLDFQNAHEMTDLNQILENVISDFDLLIKQKKAVISHDHLPVIDAIPLQINQLFYNLLGNALKFSKTDAEPVITVTSAILSPLDIKNHPLLNVEFSYCEIVFSDNGIGFDQQFSEQMFLIFQRLNSREHFEGTGIGLALCKKIVINHYGDIYAESKEGDGAQFHVILPLKQ